MDAIHNVLIETAQAIKDAHNAAVADILKFTPIKFDSDVINPESVAKTVEEFERYGYTLEVDNQETQKNVTKYTLLHHGEFVVSSEVEFSFITDSEGKLKISVVKRIKPKEEPQ